MLNKQILAGCALAMLLTACGQAEKPQAEQSEAAKTQELAEKIAAKSDSVGTIASFNVPIEYYTLDNGLKVVISEDNTSTLR